MLAVTSAIFGVLAICGAVDTLTAVSGGDPTWRHPLAATLGAAALATAAHLIAATL